MDLVLVWTAIMILGLLGVVLGDAMGSDVFAALLLFWAFLFALLYGIVYPAHCGQTFGKHVVGIQIVRRDDGSAALGGGRAIGREFVKGLGTNLFGLGLLWILLDQDRQGWHDKAARTLVVRSDQPRLNIGEFLSQPFVDRA